MTHLSEARSADGRIGNPSHEWRTLWLVFERPPHPDAVSFPAGEADVRFAIELLRPPYTRRCDLAVQLRNFLADESTRSPFDRRLVPIRHVDDGCRLVPWRFAKWLVHVLPAEDGIVDRTSRRLGRWLDGALLE